MKLFDLSPPLTKLRVGVNGNPIVTPRNGMWVHPAVKTHRAMSLKTDGLQCGVHPLERHCHAVTTWQYRTPFFILT